MAKNPLQAHHTLATPIFVFDDYVDYLKVWYDYTRRFRFTQADFIKKAGVGTQAYFSDILARRKKLALQHINGFANTLGLTGAAFDFFTLLVLKEHAKNGQEKATLLKKISSIRVEHLSEIVANADAEYFSSWKYPVVREYIVSKKRVASYREIKHAFLHFTMSIDEIRKTVDKLVAWGLVEVDSVTGQITPKNDPLTIQYSAMPHAVVNDVKRLFIESSVHAMETLPKEVRHITMALKGIRKEKYAEFCRKIDDLRKEFLEDDADGTDVEYVYGLNVQLFPLMNLALNKQNMSDDSDAGSTICDR